MEIVDLGKVVVDSAKKLYEGDDVVNKKERRVKDEYVGDPNVDPLAGLVQQQARKAGKRPLPPKEYLMSEMNYRVRMSIVSHMRNGAKYSPKKAEAIVHRVVKEIKDSIFDPFEVKPAFLQTVINGAKAFWQSRK